MGLLFELKHLLDLAIGGLELADEVFPLWENGFHLEISRYSQGKSTFTRFNPAWQLAKNSDKGAGHNREIPPCCNRRQPSSQPSLRHRGWPSEHLSKPEPHPIFRLGLAGKVQQIHCHASVARNKPAHHIRATLKFVSDLGELRSPYIYQPAQEAISHIWSKPSWLRNYYLHKPPSWVAFWLSEVLCGMFC